MPDGCCGFMLNIDFHVNSVCPRKLSWRGSRLKCMWLIEKTSSSIHFPKLSSHSSCHFSHCPMMFLWIPYVMWLSQVRGSTSLCGVWNNVPEYRVETSFHPALKSSETKSNDLNRKERQTSRRKVYKFYLYWYFMWWRQLHQKTRMPPNIYTQFKQQQQKPNTKNCGHVRGGRKNGLGLGNMWRKWTDGRGDVVYAD